MAVNSPQNEERTYEQAINRLEEVVARLENGELPLEESLNLFEEGMKLISECNQKLDSAEGNLQELLSIAKGVAQAKKIGKNNIEEECEQ